MSEPKKRKAYTISCKDCGREFKNGSPLSNHVRKEHGYNSYEDYKLKHGLTKTKEQLLEEGAVECVICKNCASHDLTSHITRMHKMSVAEYREKYNSPTRSTKFLNDMSERFKGENNPAYNHGGRLSPFSDKFVHVERIDKKKLCEKVSKSNRENGNNDTTLLYWTKLGYSEAEAKEKLSERQRTFTLEKCISKYGKEEGTKRWKQRQEKWLKSFKKTNFSKISQKLFWELVKYLDNLDCVYFAELNPNKEKDISGKNNEYRLNLKNSYVLPDFINTRTRKIIEFDGDYWHGKKHNMSANKKREDDRDQRIKECGYEILHIKENEFNQNKDETIKKCIKFLSE